MNFLFHRDCLPQAGNACHGRVLVEIGVHGFCDSARQRPVAAEVGKALSKIDSTFFGGQRRHDGKDGGAHLGQTAVEGGGVIDDGAHGAGDRGVGRKKRRLRFIV